MAALRVSVGGWNGEFYGMTGLSRLQPGYYGDLQRYPFHNAAKGGLSWSGNGRGCNTLKGWFVVDSVSYSLGQMTAIDLRFEQHCEGGAAAQRGVIHWVKQGATRLTSHQSTLTPAPPSSRVLSAPPENSISCSADSAVSVETSPPDPVSR